MTPGADIMTTKRRFIKHLPLVLASLALGLGVFVSVDGFRSNKEIEETTAYYTPSTHYEVSDTTAELNSYYSSISSSDTGTSLLTKLQNLNSTKRKKTMGYNTMGTSASSSPYIYTDYPLNSTSTDSNGQKYGTSIASFYTKTSATSFNKEHVWPNSRGGSNVEADILHTRPTISSENSSRGNSFYVEGMNTNSNGWDPHTAGYDAACRGECARIILYSVVASSNLSLSDASAISSGGSGYSTTMGDMDTLIKWHFAYSPSVYEINRNNGAEYLQGNRNPFVDHPEYVARIWSNFNSNISSLCSQNSSMYENWVPGSASSYGTNDAVNYTGVTISNTGLSLTVDASTTISATSSDSSTITWSTSDSSVASISSTSVASGASITVTANAVGTATITAKATINSTLYSKTCTVTVTTSGGTTPEGDSYTIVNTDMPSSYPSSDTDCTAASGLKFKAYQAMNQSGKIQLKNGQGYLYNSESLNLGTLKVNGLSGTITVYKGNSSHPTSTTVTGSNGSYDLSGSNYFTIKANSGSVVTCSSIEVGISSSSTKTLSSISVKTAPSKTTYTAGEYFSPTGLVINRYYSDSTNDTYTYAGHTSEFTFTPSTSTALTVSHTSVTIGYGGKSCSQAITVNAPTPTSITASVSKTYHVGETISTSDITVKDNNNNTVTGFSFSNNGYQFLYTDAPSGGSTTSKTFSNSISYSNLSCNLTVNVSRSAYAAPSTVTDTITASDLTATGTSYSNFSNVSKTSGAKYAGNSAKNNAGAIQMRSNNSNSGIVSTTSGGSVSSVIITVSSGSATISVYGKNTAYSAATDLYNNSTQGTLVGSTSSTGTITFSTSYTYVGIRSNSGAAYLTSVAITYGSSESAKNIANYIMYADTNGQCTTKLSTAVGYIKNLSTDEKATFQTSSDYVISTARTRLEAWATSQGKVINYSTGTLSNAVNSSINFVSKENNSKIIMVIILATVGMSTIGACLFIRRKRAQ